VAAACVLCSKTRRGSFSLGCLRLGLLDPDIVPAVFRGTCRLRIAPSGSHPGIGGSPSAAWFLAVGNHDAGLPRSRHQQTCSAPARVRLLGPVRYRRSRRALSSQSLGLSALWSAFFWSGPLSGRGGPAFLAYARPGHHRTAAPWASSRGLNLDAESPSARLGAWPLGPGALGLGHESALLRGARALHLDPVGVPLALSLLSRLLSRNRRQAVCRPSLRPRELAARLLGLRSLDLVLPPPSSGPEDITGDTARKRQTPASQDACRRRDGFGGPPFTPLPAVAVAIASPPRRHERLVPRGPPTPSTSDRHACKLPAFLRPPTRGRHRRGKHCRFIHEGPREPLKNQPAVSLAASARGARLPACITPTDWGDSDTVPEQSDLSRAPSRASSGVRRRARSIPVRLRVSSSLPFLLGGRELAVARSDHSAIDCRSGLSCPLVLITTLCNHRADEPCRARQIGT